MHTFVRPVGGALLALAIVDPGDPATQVIAFLLGGGAALLAHGGKAGARAVVNTSPEPFSNVVGLDRRGRRHRRAAVGGLSNIR